MVTVTHSNARSTLPMSYAQCVVVRPTLRFREEYVQHIHLARDIPKRPPEEQPLVAQETQDRVAPEIPAADQGHPRTPEVNQIRAIQGHRVKDYNLRRVANQEVMDKEAEDHRHHHHLLPQEAEVEDPHAPHHLTEDDSPINPPAQEGLTYQTQVRRRMTAFQIRNEKSVAFGES